MLLHRDKYLGLDLMTLTGQLSLLSSAGWEMSIGQGTNAVPCSLEGTRRSGMGHALQSLCNIHLRGKKISTSPTVL